MRIEALYLFFFLSALSFPRAGLWPSEMVFRSAKVFIKGFGVDLRSAESVFSKNASDCVIKKI